jgi:molecular chaperone GrpE (heat shock protein)
MTETLTAELQLSSAAAADVQGTMTDVNTVDRVRGWKWKLASRLQTVLTTEQKERLFNLTERFEERDVFGLVCFVGPRGLAGPDWHYRADFKNRLHVLRLISDLLSAEQIEQIRAIENRYHAAVRELIASARAGNITREEFRTELSSLIESVTAEIRALLTDEQIAALEEILAERKQSFEEVVAAMKAAMYEALEATVEQIDAVESLCDRLTTSKDALFAQFVAGELTREELKSALNELNEIEKEQLMVVLDSKQMEIVLIHKALTLRSRRIDMRRHRDRATGDFNTGDGGPLFGENDLRG